MGCLPFICCFVSSSLRLLTILIWASCISISFFIPLNHHLFDNDIRCLQDCTLHLRSVPTRHQPVQVSETISRVLSREYPVRAAHSSASLFHTQHAMEIWTLVSSEQRGNSQINSDWHAAVIFVETICWSLAVSGWFTVASLDQIRPVCWSKWVAIVSVGGTLTWG